MIKDYEKRFTQHYGDMDPSPTDVHSDERLERQIAWHNTIHEFELLQLQIRFEQETDLMNDLLRRYQKLVAEGKVKDEPL